MAGSMLAVTVAGAPSSARLAIARPEDPADRAIVVVPLPATAAATLPTPGQPGPYELRLMQDRDGTPAILLRQPLATTPASATLAAPLRVGRGKSIPVRGIGPNGDHDRIVLVRRDAGPEIQSPFFFPAENIESTLEVPDEPGDYELRYVMNAPLAMNVILARQPVHVT